MLQAQGKAETCVLFVPHGEVRAPDVVEQIEVYALLHLRLAVVEVQQGR